MMTSKREYIEGDKETNAEDESKSAPSCDDIVINKRFKLQDLVEELNEDNNCQEESTNSTACEGIIDSSELVIKQEEYSSERFKLQMLGVPNINFGELKRLCDNMKINARKMKKASGRNGEIIIFLSFRDDETKEAARAIINNYTYRGKLLRAIDAQPLLPKTHGAHNSKKPDEAKNKVQFSTDEEFEKEMFEKVAPLHDKTYEEQINYKTEKVELNVTKLAKLIRKVNPSFIPTSNVANLSHNQFHIQISPFLKSPVVDNYRNKAEFTIGKSVSGRKMGGLRANSSDEGVVTVGRVENLKLFSPKIIQMLNVFNTYLNSSSSFEPFNPMSKEGTLISLTLRHSSLDESLVLLHISDQGLSDERENELKSDLMNLYSGDSIFIKKREVNGQRERNKPIHVSGKEMLPESFMGFNFNVSPEAFFQVNNSAATLMCRSILSEGELTKETTVVDVCCGTGTLGLSCILSGGAGEVIGIELCEGALKGARLNAQMNCVSDKCKFFCGRAEELLQSGINSAKFEHVILIVDPPRSGLSASVVTAIRKCKKVDKVIYIACDLEKSQDNIVSLAKPETKRIQGCPFLPTKVIPIDMFPHTRHIENIIILNRVVA